MTTQGKTMAADQTTTASFDRDAAERYRQAERRLWNVYGLEPSEHIVDLPEPALRLRVVEVGEGAPILFIPGTGGTGPYWAPLVRELQGYRCLMLDRPGWGLSSTIRYAADTYRDDAARIAASVLDALGIARASVVGASIGDVWAMGLARSVPERVDRVVLLGSGPMREEIQPPRFLRLLATPVGALIVRIPEGRRLIAGQLAGLGHAASLEAGRFPGEFFEWRSAFARETKSMHNERQMVADVIQSGRLADGLTFGDAELARIVPPALLIIGSEDPVGSIGLWRKFMGMIPHGEIELLENAGHLPWWDDSSRVGRRMRAFLDS
jgi:pimeloyl-ACP methyl ester carboxylesterase